MTTSGYTSCACEGCFDVTVSSDVTEPELCELCQEAGCGDSGECQVLEMMADDIEAQYVEWTKGE